MKNYNIDDYCDGEIVSSNELKLEKPPFGWKFIEGERSSKYSFYGVLNELIDNSMDASAEKIDIILHTNENGELIKISIKDDGNGMSSEELSGSFRIGSSKKKTYAKNSIGKFGRGGTLGCISIARKKSTFTIKDGILLGRGYNLDVVKEQDQWVSIELSVPPEIVSLLEETGGTLIELTEFDLIRSKKVSTLKPNLIQKIAQQYNPYLAKGCIEVTVNGEKVKPWDPLLLDHEKTEKWLDGVQKEGEDYFFWPDEYGALHRVTLKAVYLEAVKMKDKCPDGKARTLGKIQGGYFYRNNRIINEEPLTSANGLTGFYRSHSNKRNFRFSVSYPSELDKQFGTFKSKDGFNMEQNLSNKIADIIRHHASAAERRCKSSDKQNNQQSLDSTLESVTDNLNNTKNIRPEKKKYALNGKTKSVNSSNKTKTVKSVIPKADPFMIVRKDWDDGGLIAKITKAPSSESYDWLLEINESHPAIVSCSGYEKAEQKSFFTQIVSVLIAAEKSLNEEDKDEFIHQWSRNLSRLSRED